MKKFLVLNELHPEEQAGAATIALDYATALGKVSDTLFVHTSNFANNSEMGSLEIKIPRRNRRQNLDGYRGELLRVAIDLFGFITMSKYLREIRKLKPDVIWVHQIGNFIPRLLIFFLPLVAPVVMTVHDYSLIVPRKLYPKDLNKRRLDSLRVKYTKSHEGFLNIPAAIVKSNIYRLRRLILRLFLRGIKLVCISQQQAQIYKSFGYRVHAVIPNGISKCECSNPSNFARLNSVLFLGRVTGKGVDRLLASVADQEVRVVFAGGEDLDSAVRLYPRDINAVFLGRLDRSQVLKEIHKTTFVYLASDCFDVYPNTGIEAIRHGALPIVSDTTGVRDLVQLIDASFILDSTQTYIPFDNYFQNVENHMDILYAKLRKVNESLPTVEESLDKYLKIMRIL